MKRGATATASSASKKVKVDERSDAAAFPFKVSWREEGEPGEKGLRPLIVLDGPDVHPSSKVIGFDLDDTLIVVASGKKWPQGPKDWKFWNGKVAEKLKDMHDKGFKVAVFTNQLGIEKGKTDAKVIQAKLLDIMSKLGFAIQAFISTAESHFRKPSPMMWDFMVEKCNGGVAIDVNQSVYVGDAAGRPKGWALGKKKDFSCSDRKFAANAGVKFMTPEEFFDGAKPYPKFEWDSIDPKKLLADVDKHCFDLASLPSKAKEMVILVGPPASGKSTLSELYFQKCNYVSINRDTLKTQEKCLKIAADSIAKGKSVVIDNTNPSKEARKHFIDMAVKAGVPVRVMNHYGMAAPMPFKIAKLDRRFKGIVAGSLLELKEKAVACLCIASASSSVLVHLAEDDTEVDNEEYFATLTANTKLIVKTSGQTGLSAADFIDGSGEYLLEDIERTESQEIRASSPGYMHTLRKLSSEGISSNLSMIMTLSTSELSSFVEAPLTAVMEELRVDKDFAIVLSDAALNEVQRREELIQASQLLSMYQRAKHVQLSGHGAKRKKDAL